MQSRRDLTPKINGILGDAQNNDGWILAAGSLNTAKDIVKGLFVDALRLGNGFGAASVNFDQGWTDLLSGHPVSAGYQYILGIGNELQDAARAATWITAIGGLSSSAFKLAGEEVNLETAASRLAANQQAGKAAEELLHLKYGGVEQVTKTVNLNGQPVRRVIDILVDDVAMESKVGRVSRTSDIETQIAKDVELMKNQNTGVKTVEWHFSKSNVTGKIGPTPSIEEALRNAGIKIVYEG